MCQQVRIPVFVGQDFRHNRMQRGGLGAIFFTKLRNKNIVERNLQLYMLRYVKATLNKP